MSSYREHIESEEQSQGNVKVASYTKKHKNHHSLQSGSTQDVYHLKASNAIAISREVQTKIQELG